MTASTTARTYVAFNLVEAILWIALATFLWRVDKDVRSVVVRYLLPTLFVIFSVTDLVEVGIQGPLPGYLWWAKLLIGSMLFGLANYRDHVAFGNLTVGKVVLRVVAFVGLVWFYLNATAR